MTSLSSKPEGARSPSESSDATPGTFASAVRRFFGHRAPERLEDFAPRQWPGPGDHGGLVESSSELRALLRGLDYSPRAERRWPELATELESAVREGDAGRREQGLAELENLVGIGVSRRRERARRGVLAAAVELRDQADPAGLERLRDGVETWLFRGQAESASKRRQELDGLLRDLAEARHRWGRTWPLEDEAVAAFHAAAREHAGRYLEARWLHTPFVTRYVLANLLASELAPRLAEGSGRRTANGVEVLRDVWIEVAGGCFDGETTLARLRGLEADGLRLPSVAHSLLRLYREPPPPREKLAAPSWELTAASWPGPRAVAEILLSSAGLCSLLRDLGFSPRAEAAWSRLREQLRKAPDRAGALTELENLLEVSRSPRRERARQLALSALAGLRGEPGKEDAANGRLLAVLEEKVEDWLHEAHSRPARQRRRELEDLLGDLAEARHRHGQGWPLAAGEIATFRGAAREHARRYLDSDGWHTRSLTTYVLANLLASELAARMAGPDRDRQAVGDLRRAWGEIVSGDYDRRELTRRLRRLETSDRLSLPSLVYPLLRIDPEPSAVEPAAGSEPTWELADQAWLGPAKVARLFETRHDLRLLLETLGFSPRAEERWPGLWRQLKASIKVEIPDFAAFRAALEGIKAQLEAATSESADPLAAAWYEKRDDPLLCDVLAAVDDERAVLEILGEDAVDRVLPFVERIPFVRDDRVSWRMPVAIPLLHKRPRDPEAFAGLLDEVVGLLEEARTKRRQQAHQEVLDSLARLRKTLEAEDVYVPAPLKSLEGKFLEWLLHAYSARVLERRRDLEGLLGGMAEARHRWGRGWPLAREEVTAFRSATLDHARSYLGAEWMHGSELTAYALTNLLASELAPLMSQPELRSSAPVSVLRRIWGEVASGLFDRRETQRRLRELEAEGLFVHSLAYSLLRLEG